MSADDAAPHRRSRSPAPAARSTRCARSRRCSQHGHARRPGDHRLRPAAAARRTRARGAPSIACRPTSRRRYGEGVRRGGVRPAQQQGSRRDASPAAARAARRMVIVPCSMKTLAGVAHGLSRNLVERAADVMLKERRPLVIVPRETPMSLPQLRNMVLCAEAGAIVLPAMPAFYQLPQTIDDLADFMAGKILSAAAASTTSSIPRGTRRRAANDALDPGPTYGGLTPDTAKAPAKIAGMFDAHRRPLRPAQPPAERRAGPLLAVAGRARAAPDRAGAACSTSAPAPATWRSHAWSGARRGAARRSASTSRPRCSRSASASSAARAATASIPLVRGDAMRLPVATASMDAVTIAFGIRNVQDASVALREVRAGAQARRPAGHPRVRDAAAAADPGRLPLVLPQRPAADRAGSCRGTTRPTPTCRRRWRASRRPDEFVAQLAGGRADALRGRPFDLRRRLSLRRRASGVMLQAGLDSRPTGGSLVVGPSQRGPHQAGPSSRPYHCPPSATLPHLY